MIYLSFDRSKVKANNISILWTIPSKKSTKNFEEIQDKLSMLHNLRSSDVEQHNNKGIWYYSNHQVIWLENIFNLRTKLSCGQIKIVKYITEFSTSNDVKVHISVILKIKYSQVIKSFFSIYYSPFKTISWMKMTKKLCNWKIQSYPSIPSAKFGPWLPRR